MKKNLIYILFVLLPVLFCTVSEAGGEDEEESKKEIIDSLVIKNGVIIAEIEESGRKKYELTGTHGEMLKADVIRIFNVKAFFNQDNGERVFIMTDSADFNKKTKEMKTDEYVEIMFEDGVITGIGMECESGNKIFRILDKVKITLHAKSSDIGIKLPK